MRTPVLSVALILGASALLGAVVPASAQAPAGTADTLAADIASADSLGSGAARAGVPVDSLFAALPVAPQSATAETLQAPVSADGVAVFLGGQPVLRVRVGRGGLDVEERASAIRDRLTRAIADERVPVDSLRFLRTTDGLEVRLGPHFLGVVTPTDVQVARVEDIAPSLVELRERLREGIQRERRERTPARFLLMGLVALGLLLLIPALIRLDLWVGRRWRDWLERVVGRHLGSLRAFGFEIVPRWQLLWLLRNTVGRLDLVALLFVLYGVLTAAFSYFPWTQGWSWHLARFAQTTFLNVLRAVLKIVPNLIIIVVILVISRWVRQLSDRFFNAVTDGTIKLAGLQPELGPPSRRLVGIIIWIITIVILYPYIPGSDSRAVQGATIVLGAMLSLGSTGIVGNVLAGLVLTYSLAFRVGDRVRIGEHVGDITDLGLFSTKLRSVQNEEITLPNGVVAAQPILNFSRLAAEGLMLKTSVSIGYDAPWRTVHALLLEAAGRVDGIDPEPEARVFQRTLADYYIVYDLYCATRRPQEQLRLYSDLHAEIQDAFARAGVEILSPAFTNLRDANQPILPPEPQGPRAAPGGFRVRGEDKK